MTTTVLEGWKEFSTQNQSLYKLILSLETLFSFSLPVLLLYVIDTISKPNCVQMDEEYPQMGEPAWKWSAFWLLNAKWKLIVKFQLQKYCSCNQYLYWNKNFHLRDYEFKDIVSQCKDFMASSLQITHIIGTQLIYHLPSVLINIWWCIVICYSSTLVCFDAWFSKISHF